MTEVKPINVVSNTKNDNNGSLGLFATKDYVEGDVILIEQAPLIRLAPTTHEEYQILNDCLVVDDTTKSNKDDKNDITDKDKSANSNAVNSTNQSAQNPLTSLSINVPGTIDKSFVSKFQGMVQAALCYAKHVSEKGTLDALLDLYHPNLQKPNIEEEEIVQLARQAYDYLLEHLTMTLHSEISSFIRDNRDTCVKVMLIWSCNSFEGGRLYNLTSRVNHSCAPNAVVLTTLPSNNNTTTTTTATTTIIATDSAESQSILAATTIKAGTEITISYLGLYLYADGPTRQQNLRQTKHFTCTCLRCTSSKPDRASALPCLVCHPRHSSLQLDEDVQYDDEQNVHYMMMMASREPEELPIWQCEHCKSIIKDNDNGNDNDDTRKNYKLVLKASQKTINNVYMFLQDTHLFFDNNNKINSNDNDDDDDNEDEELLKQELLDNHLRFTYTLLGAKHWTTNLLLLMQLDNKLQTLHGELLEISSNNNDNDECLESLAECIDTLERVTRFVDDLQEDLPLHRGHLLSNVIIDTARALVSLGDAKSQKYASQWLEKVQDYVTKFESDDVNKIVFALSNAWKRRDPNLSNTNSKRARIS